jgi:peptidoglycan/LPS O-acetylase OafA/YrhL
LFHLPWITNQTGSDRIYFAYGLVSVWLIGRGAEGFGGLTGRILSLGLVIYIGRIGYGIYVIHGALPLLSEWVRERCGVSTGYQEQPGLAQFFYVAVVSVVLATVSYRWFEKPINDLKRYFPYESPGFRK